MGSAADAAARRVTDERWRGVCHLLVALLALAAQPAVAQRALESVELEVGDFQRVHFSGPGVIHLSQGPEARLTARGTADTLANLSVEARDGTLRIEMSGTGSGPVLFLQVAGLEELTGDGAGHIIAHGLQLDSLRVVGSGAGSFRLQGLEAVELVVEGRGATRFDLSGQVGRQRVELSGTGAYSAGSLISNRTSVMVAGSSDVRLWADEWLDVEVAGTADIRYAGSPEVEQRITGIASVLRIAQIVI